MCLYNRIFGAYFSPVKTEQLFYYAIARKAEFTPPLSASPLQTQIPEFPARLSMALNQVLYDKSGWAMLSTIQLRQRN